MADEKAGSSRIITTKPRSESISDVRKLDSILSTLTIDNEKREPKSDGLPNEIYTQELSGVFLKRVPFALPSSDNTGTVPSYDYIVENKREYKVRVVMEFKGTNLKIKSSSHAKHISELTVEGLLEVNASATFASVHAADGKNDFSFSAEIKVFPDQDDIRVADLEGVKLFTTVTYQDLITIMHFEAHNQKDFDVEVELDLKGKLLEHSSPLPFTKVVPAGKRVAIGTAKSDSEIESAWKWQQVLDPASIAPNAVLEGKKITQTSELKGVTLKQSMTPGDPTLIEFEVVNSRDKKIAVSIDLEGDGFINFRTQSRPLVGEVFAKQTAFVGVVEIKGDATVNWKYKEVSDD